MLHQRNCVSTLGFTVSDPIVESHLQLAVITDKCFLKVNFLTVIGEFLEVQQRQVVGGHRSDRSLLEEILNQTRGDYSPFVNVCAQQDFVQQIQY